MVFFYLLPVHLLIINTQRRKPDELAQCSHYIKVVSLGFKARIECGCGCDEWQGAECLKKGVLLYFVNNIYKISD